MAPGDEHDDSLSDHGLSDHGLSDHGLSDHGLGQLLFYVRCRWLAREPRVKPVHVTIVVGILATYAFVLLLWPNGPYVAAQVGSVGLTATFVVAFLLWRSTRRLFVLFEHGFQVQGGNRVELHATFTMLRGFRQEEQRLVLVLDDSREVRLEFGKLGVEDVADFLEGRVG